MTLLRSFVLLSSLSAVACGGSSAGVDDPAPDPSGGGEGSSGSPGSSGAPGTGSSGGASSGGPAASGPHVSIEMRGSTSPFAHVDAFSGQTPKRQIVAIKSLWLLRHPSDPKPVKVFDHGADAVEVDLVTGKPVVLAKVPVKPLPAGVFTVAKAGAAYVRYTVGARMHTPLPIDGQYENVQALSDGAVIDGVARDKGYFRYSFASGGVTYGTLEGEDAPTPVATSNGGLTMDMSGPETFYVFPVQVAIDPGVTEDYAVSFEVNVFESFRWQDQAMSGYQPKVFDTTPSTFEPVMAFGANSFTLVVGPK